MAGIARWFTDLFPPILKQDPDYSVFINMGSELFNWLYYTTGDLPQQVDPDLCQAQFLPYLGALVGYDWKDDKTPESQREPIKKALWKAKRRGSYSAIADAVIEATEEALGPGHEMEIQRAIDELFTPSEWLFVLSKSEISTQYHFPDMSYWRDGILDIALEYIDENIIKAILDVIPAGIKVWFTTLVVVFDPDHLLGAISYFVNRIWSEKHIQFDIVVQDRVEGMILSEPPPDGLISGRQVLYLSIYIMLDLIPDPFSREHLPFMTLLPDEPIVTFNEQGPWIPGKILDIEDVIVYFVNSVEQDNMITFTIYVEGGKDFNVREYETSLFNDLSVSRRRQIIPSPLYTLTEVNPSRFLLDFTEITRPNTMVNQINHQAPFDISAESRDFNGYYARLPTSSKIRFLR